MTLPRPGTGMRRLFFWIALVATFAVVLVGGLERLLQTEARSIHDIGSYGADGAAPEMR